MTNKLLYKKIKNNICKPLDTVHSPLNSIKLTFRSALALPSLYIPLTLPRWYLEENCLAVGKSPVETRKAPTTKVTGVSVPAFVCKLGLLQSVGVFLSRCLTSFVSQHRQYPPWLVVRCRFGLGTAIQISAAWGSLPTASHCYSWRMTQILALCVGGNMTV